MDKAFAAPAADDIADRYDPREPSHRQDPGAAYEALRALCPVLHVRTVEPSYFTVSRAADVEAMVMDVATWRNARGQGLHYRDGAPGPLGGMDGPDHGRQRAAIMKYFMPASLRTLRPRIQQLVDDLFDAFKVKGAGDFVTEIAYPLPALVVAEILGVPHGDRAWFKIRSDRALKLLDGDPAGVAIGMTARDELTEYLDARIAEAVAEFEARGTIDRDDLLSHMVLEWKTKGTLSHAEINDIGKIVLIAGHETTTSLIGMMMGRLIERPDIARRLRDEPDRIPVFVEEVLRLDGPVQGLFRTSPEATEVHGHLIPPETKVQLLFASANLDPDRFENPATLSLDRDLPDLRRRNLGFGAGLHFCIGAPVARMEAEMAVARMIRDFPDAAFDGPVAYVTPFILRGYSKLPMRWTVTG